MGSNPDHLPRFAAPLAITTSALCWWFGTGLQPQWWGAWLAALPSLLLAARSSARQTAFATATAFVLGGTNMWHYLHDVLRLPLPACVGAILWPSLLMTLPVLLWRALARRGHAFAALFAFPLAMTGLSWLSAALSPHGSFGNVAYTQMDTLPVIQIAALAGAWAVGFIVWLLASALALACAQRTRMAATATGLALVAAALCFGGWRLHDNAAASSIRVGLVGINLTGKAQADVDTPEGQRLLAAYAAQMETLAARGAQVIVAPESALLVRSHAIGPLQELASRHSVRILIGVEDHSDPARKHNAALVFSPASSAPAHYFKRHLIPGFEDRYTPGNAPLVLEGDADAARIGIAICKDFDFTAIGREYGQLGVELMLAPAWDFNDDAWLHGRMAILRGVENGYAMARSAREGLLSLSDDRGRVLAQASTVGVNAPVALLGELPLRSTRTPYTRIGDAFGPVSLCAALLLALLLLFRRGKK